MKKLKVLCHYVLAAGQLHSCPARQLGIWTAGQRCLAARQLGSCVACAWTPEAFAGPGLPRRNERSSHNKIKPRMQMHGIRRFDLHRATQTAACCQSLPLTPTLQHIACMLLSAASCCATCSDCIPVVVAATHRRRTGGLLLLALPDNSCKQLAAASCGATCCLCNVLLVAAPCTRCKDAGLFLPHTSCTQLAAPLCGATC